MSVVVPLPKKVGPKAPRHVARRVKYRRQAPAPVVALRNDKERAYDLYLAGSRIDETDISAAMQLYAQAIQLDPMLALAHTNLGNCYYRQGNSHVARRSYELALERDPSQPEALYNLGYLCLEADEFERAIELISKAVALDPKFADAWFNLGVAYEKRLGTSRSPAVYRCFQKFIQLAPANDQWVEQARARLG